MERKDKALQKLEAKPLADRIAAVAADVDSKRDEFRSIDAHELANLLDVVEAHHPSHAGDDWKFVWYIARTSIEDIIWNDDETVLELFPRSLNTPEIRRTR